MEGYGFSLQKRSEGLTINLGPQTSRVCTLRHFISYLAEPGISRSDLLNKSRLEYSQLILDGYKRLGQTKDSFRSNLCFLK